MSAGYCKKRTTPEERQAELAEWVGDPWYDELVKLNVTLEAQDPSYNMYQVKAKFGELDFHFLPSPGVPDFKLHIMDRAVQSARMACWMADKKRQKERA